MRGLATIALIAIGCGSTTPSSPPATTREPAAKLADAAAARPSPASPPVNVATIFPELDGFSHGAPALYTAANLYDYINGAAELFIRYGFEQLHSLEYSRGQGPTEQAITVNIYRHSSVNNGYGIYSRDRIRAPELADIGGAAVYQTGALHFLKDRYYVKLSGYQLGDADATLLAQTGRSVAGALTGGSELPRVTSCFPAASPAPTVNYHASGYLGHGFLESVFAAEIGGARVFIAEARDPAAAIALRNRYIALAEKKGLTPTVAQGIHRFADPYHRDWGEVHARATGRYLCAVITADEKLARTYLSEIEARLEAAGLLR